MQLTYELSPDDYAASQRLYFRKRQAPLSWLFAFFGVLILLIGLAQLNRGPVVPALVSLVFSAFCFGFIPVVIPLIAKGSWAKLQILHGRTTFQTSSEGIEIFNPMTRSFVRWAVVHDVIESPQMWLVFIAPTLFYLVPKRALALEEELARFRAEMSSRGAGAFAGNAPLSSP